jgi:hypothetical protein
MNVRVGQFGSQFAINVTVEVCNENVVATLTSIRHPSFTHQHLPFKKTEIFSAFITRKCGVFLEYQTGVPPTQVTFQETDAEINIYRLHSCGANSQCPRHSSTALHSLTLSVLNL